MIFLRRTRVRFLRSARSASVVYGCLIPSRSSPALAHSATGTMGISMIFRHAEVNVIADSRDQQLRAQTPSFSSDHSCCCPAMLQPASQRPTDRFCQHSVENLRFSPKRILRVCRRLSSSWKLDGGTPDARHRSVRGKNPLHRGPSYQPCLPLGCCWRNAVSDMP